jgi:hypothetical protein
MIQCLLEYLRAVEWRNDQDGVTADEAGNEWKAMDAVYK